MHTKSGYSEHHLKNGKLSAWHRRKRQRGFCDGLGLFLGEESRDFLSRCCEIGECKGIPQVAEYLVLPVMQRINDTIGDAVFQRDNAPVHTASAFTEWFEQCNIKVDKPPPYSPDLNPIEHVWVVLKQQFHKQYPDIADTPGGPDAVRARLVEVLPKVWDSLPEQFNNLIEVCQIGWQRLLMPRGGIQGTKHVFLFNSSSHCKGGLATI